jgi:hypothetical protein
MGSFNCQGIRARSVAGHGLGRQAKFKAPRFCFSLADPEALRNTDERSAPANSSNVCILFASLHYSVNGSVRPTQLATKSAAE